MNTMRNHKDVIGAALGRIRRFFNHESPRRSRVKYNIESEHRLTIVEVAVLNTSSFGVR